MTWCSLPMKPAIPRAGSAGEGKALGLLAGALVAILLALLFGACLWTVLDVKRPSAPTASATGAGTGYPAPGTVSASSDFRASFGN